MQLESENIVNLSQEEFSWLDEEIENVPNNRFLYKCFCFLLRKKKMTYQDLYIIYCRLYNNKTEYKKTAIKKIGELYYYNNSRFPLKNDVEYGRE